MPTVLEIAHGFPPAGGSGSHRALAFARYLPEYGWRPVVLTTGAAWAANRDDSLVAEVPRDLRIIRTRSLEPRPSRPPPPPPPPHTEGEPRPHSPPPPAPAAPRQPKSRLT